ncbi:pre-rRNA-processing protein TSR1 [Nematocida sp. AWRm77]|nr:pre-rRNA-processing protein TSR1 [Nematocida sp. AWRm77]
MSRQQNTRHKKSAQSSAKEKGSIVVVVTSLDPHVSPSEAFSVFERMDTGCSEKDPESIRLGMHVHTKRNKFVFLSNSTGSSSLRRLRISLADINIVLVGQENMEETEDLLKQTRQSNLVFLACTASSSAGTRKYVTKTFGKQKVYSASEIGRVLDSKAVVNRKKQMRPGMVAQTVEKLSDTQIRVTGALEKGFVSHNVLLNGSMQATITGISIQEQPLSLSALKPLTREDLYRSKATREEKEENVILTRIKDISIAEQMEIEAGMCQTNSLGALGSLGWMSTKDLENAEDAEDAESRDEMSIDEESEENANSNDFDGGDFDSDGSDSDDGDDSGSYSSSPDNGSPDGLPFAQYKGFRSINLGVRSGSDSSQLKAFREQNLPEHYSQLNFVQSEHVRRKLLAKKSPVPVQTLLTVTLEIDPSHTMEFLEEFISLQGLFDYEGLPTICTLSFSSSTPLSSYTSGPITMDHGFCFSAPPEFVVGTGTDIVKCKREGTSGTLCYIGPLVLTDDKVFLVKDNQIVGTGMQCLRKDPIVLATVTFKGRPVKINKRLCTIGKMFRTREEVLRFKDVRLYSSDRKEGRIKKPLGQHGLMKCYFCPPLKHTEKVYMELARRVFLEPPQWMGLSSAQ